MSRPEAIALALVVGPAVWLGVFTQMPWLARLFRRLSVGFEQLARAVFYRGRHFATTTEEQPITVAEIATKLRREAREAAMSAVSIRIEPDVVGFSRDVRRALLGLFEHPERFAPEQLGAMSV